MKCVDQAPVLQKGALRDIRSVSNAGKGFRATPWRTPIKPPIQSCRGGLSSRQQVLKRHCQRKVARTEFSTDDRELGHPELTPLGERGGAVELEIVS